MRRAALYFTGFVLMLFLLPPLAASAATPPGVDVQIVDLRLVRVSAPVTEPGACGEAASPDRVAELLQQVLLDPGLLVIEDLSDEELAELAEDDWQSDPEIEVEAGAEAGLQAVADRPAERLVR